MKENENKTGDEDFDTLSRCKKGDINAFESLVKKYQKRMLNIAYRVIGDYEDACEIVQDAFVSAYKNIKDFKGRSRFSTWLYTIVVNLSRNRLRQLKAQSYHEGFSFDDPVATDDGEIKMSPLSVEPSALDNLERKEIQQKVQRCIDTLNNEFREVLILRDIQGFSYNEIGDMLGISEGTVKSRLFRAREYIKGCLKNVIVDDS